MEITLPHGGWTPRWYQMPAWKAFRNPDVKTIVLAWARRHGKDDVAMHATAMKAMQRVGNYYHCLPEYNQARKAIWDARNPHTGKIRWQEVFPQEVIKKVDNQSMMVTLKNDSTWQLIGADNTDSLMGASPLGIVFSEAGLMNPTAFAFFRPILLENGGWSAHISSVRGKNHFYDLYESLKDISTAFVSHISSHDTDVFSPMSLALERQLYIKQFGKAIGESLFDQEYLSEWDAAVVGAVFGAELRKLEQEGRALPLIYDRRFPVDTSWDLGVGDNTVILFWQTVGNVERLIDWYSATDIGLDHYAEVLQDKDYLYRHHFGPHDIDVREWGANGVSRKSQARRLGVKFTSTPNVPKTTSIALGSQLIDRMEINVQSRIVENPMDDCRFILEALKAYRFGFDRVKRIMSKAPVHDWTSHYADALMTKALHAGTTIISDKLPATLSDDQVFNEMRVKELLSYGRRRMQNAWG